MIWLGDVAKGRDNNFNLIRMLAATAVLVSHAWPLVYGPGTTEPLKVLTGYSLGTLSVFVFFALSGFFISASFDRSRSVGSFVAARGLRLFPGLAVSLIFVALVMGPLVGDLPKAQYFRQSETWTFLLRNITLIRSQYTLPGVFETNPYPAVEGSIWTLIHEVLCYGLVLLFGISGVLRRRNLVTIALLGYGLLWFVPVSVVTELHPRLIALRELSFPFVLGMVFWSWRDWVPLSLLGILGLSILTVVTEGTVIGFHILMLLITYVSFWLGHVPHGRVRAYNHLGDYSYGMYIYAIPIQGLVVWLFGPMTPAAHIVIAFPLTLVLSVLSWQFVEGPALRLRQTVPAQANSMPGKALPFRSTR